MRNHKASKNESKKSCKTCLPWNGIAFGGDIFYFITSYPFLIAQLLMLISGDDRDEILGVSIWSFAVAIVLDLYLTSVQTDANWVANTVNQEEVSPSPEPNVDINTVPELQNSDSGDSSDSSDDEKTKLRPTTALVKTKIQKIEPILHWYQKYYFLPFEHFANWMDYFFAPFGITALITKNKNIVAVTIGTSAFAAIYASFCSISTSITTRDAVAKFNSERSEGTQKKLDFWIWISIIFGEGLGGLAGYTYSSALAINYLANSLGLVEDVAFGFTKPALIGGSLIGFACTSAVMYCRARYYQVNQEDITENLSPLNPAQKIKLPGVLFSYCLDSVNSTVLVVLLIANNLLPRSAQIGLAAGSVALGFLTAPSPTRSSAHCYRLFNTKREKLKAIEEAKSKPTALDNSPGYQAAAGALV